MKPSSRPSSSTLVGEAAEESFSVSSSGSRPTRASPGHQEIAERARALWTKYGCPAGRDEAIWLEAERQLTGSGATPSRGGARRPSEPDDDQELAIGAGQGSAARTSRRRAV